MMELLVCLGVLGIALGSVLSVFVAGTHFAAKANRTMDAGRVARAVFDLVEHGFTIGANSYGRGAEKPGEVKNEVIRSDLLNPPVSLFPPEWRPSHVAGSYTYLGSPPFPAPLTPLVWECEVSDYASDLAGMHLLVTVVSHDSDGNGAFDAGDEVIGTYYAILADR